VARMAGLCPRAEAGLLSPERPPGAISRTYCQAMRRRRPTSHAEVRRISPPLAEPSLVYAAGQVPPRSKCSCKQQRLAYQFRSGG
jgi:hypothetical protein